LSTPARIVVGADGSEASLAAAAWAANEARARGSAISVVNVLEMPPFTSWLLRPITGSEIRHLRTAVVNRAAGAATSVEPSVEIRKGILFGSPGRVLEHLAGRSDLMVLGRPTHGAVGHFALGAVPQRLMVRASCPVVAVAAQPEGTRPVRTERVVLCATETGPDAGGAAWDFAFGCAARRGLPILVVYPEDVPAADVAERIAQAGRAHPGFAAQTLALPSADLSVALAEICRPADLAVVGHRHGRITSHFVGPAARAVLACPAGAVAVVPDSAAVHGDLVGAGPRRGEEYTMSDACGANQRHNRDEGAYARSDGPELASGPEEYT
jgi:nucleotide-binding universal stress UspA family protein